MLRVPSGSSGSNTSTTVSNDEMAALSWPWLNTQTSTPTSSFALNDNGNLTGETISGDDGSDARFGIVNGVNTLGYDPLDELSSWSLAPDGSTVTSATSTNYFLNGLRASKQWPTQPSGTSSTLPTNTYYLYDGDELLAEVDGGTGAIRAAYVGGATGLNMRYVSASSTAVGYQFDPQGNCCGTAVSSSGVNSGFSICLFDGYGLPVTNLSTGATASNAGGIEGLDPSDPMGYKGQFGCFTDVESGLVYCQHRYYSPQMGRWLTKDPIGAEGGINVYEFCGNNPIMGADPSGLDGDWLVNMANFFGAWGDELTFGKSGWIAQQINVGLGNGEFQYDQDSIYTKVGRGVGFVNSIALPAPGKLKIGAKILALGGADAARLAHAGESLRETRLLGEPYRVVSKWASRMGGEAHHVVEKRFARLFGLSERKMASIALTKGEHQFFTNSWRQYLPYGIRYTQGDVVNGARHVYEGYPEILREALNQLGVK